MSASFLYRPWSAGRPAELPRAGRRTAPIRSPYSASRLPSFRQIRAPSSSRSRSSSQRSRTGSRRRQRQQSRQPPNRLDSGTTSRVVGVEPAKSAAPAATETSASAPASPAPTATPPEDGTKVAAAEAKDTEGPRPETEKTSEAPLPESATREPLAQDMLAELSKLGCYFGSINGNWNTRSRLALDRFNRHAKLDLPLDKPRQASLDALKDWKGAHCPIEKAVPPRVKQRPVVAQKSRLRRARRCAQARQRLRRCKPCGRRASSPGPWQRRNTRATARLPLRRVARVGGGR